MLQMAADARKNAYAPYSGFAVGAALLADSGKVYLGCNIENAAYPAGNCAERTAFFKAISEGERNFLRIAIVGGNAGEAPGAPCAPCGICRQVMAEFCDADTFEIVLSGGERFLLKELLPMSFGAKNLDRGNRQ